MSSVKEYGFEKRSVLKILILWTWCMLWELGDKNNNTEFTENFTKFTKFFRSQRRFASSSKNKKVSFNNISIAINWVFNHLIFFSYPEFRLFKVKQRHFVYLRNTKLISLVVQDWKKKKKCFPYKMAKSHKLFFFFF